MTENENTIATPSRRGFLLGSALGLLAGSSVLWSQQPAAATAAPSRRGRGPAARVLPLNDDWLFGGRSTEGSSQPGFDDGDFAPVTLPHSVAALSWYDWDNLEWAGEWTYRRHFDLPPELTGLRVFVDFAGAMTATTPTINAAEPAIKP